MGNSSSNINWFVLSFSYVYLPCTGADVRRGREEAVAVQAEAKRSCVEFHRESLGESSLKSSHPNFRSRKSGGVKTERKKHKGNKTRENKF